MFIATDFDSYVIIKYFSKLIPPTPYNKNPIDDINNPTNPK